jgi:8-oxo-dGTP pyrophosphatase MutT (NUDIX family)
VTAGQWEILGEQVVDGSRRTVLSIARVRLPDGTEFEQYVQRCPASAMVLVVVDGAVLMIYRHRWIFDSWVWELPGGYINAGELPAETAVREVEEETGWRPGVVSPLMVFQPWVASADAAQHLFVAFDAEHVAATPADINEATKVGWVRVEDVPAMIADGRILGSASIIGLQALLLESLRGGM